MRNHSNTIEESKTISISDYKLFVDSEHDKEFVDSLDEEFPCGNKVNIYSVKRISKLYRAWKCEQLGGSNESRTVRTTTNH